MNRIRIGEITHKGENYIVFWDIDTKLIYCKGSDGGLLNFFETKAFSKNEVIIKAKDMLEASGYC